MVESANSLFNLTRVAAIPARAPELPEGLFASLRDFPEADYALYERAANDHGDSGRNHPVSG